jgi:hypothetical protein
MNDDSIAITQKQNYMSWESARNSVRNVGFEVLTTVVMMSSIFWDITPCSPLKVNGRFGGTGGSACHLLSRWFPTRLILRTWRWRRHVPPKGRLTFNGLHGVIFQEIELCCQKHLPSYQASGISISFIQAHRFCFLADSMCIPIKLILTLRNEPGTKEEGNYAEPWPDVSLRENTADVVYCIYQCHKFRGWEEAFLKAKRQTWRNSIMSQN